MSTGEGQDPRTGPAQRDRDDRPRRGDIGIGGGDDSVSRIQLAARWAEAYGKDSDSLTSVLKRFRTAYEYVDAIIHGVDPPELESETPESQPTLEPTYAPPSWSSPAAPAESPPPPPWSQPPEAGSPPTTPPPAEPRPWG
jgi:hypothetical protein